MLYSEPHAITVKAAATASEKSLQRLYRKPEVRHFMLLRGGAAKPETVAAVLKISENAPRTVSGTLAKLALVEHANALTTVPTANLAQFRGPEAVHVALKELRPAATTLKLYSASVERVAGAATRSMGKRAVSDALAKVRVSRRRSG